MSVFVAFNIFVFVCLYVCVSVCLCVFVFVCLCVQLCSSKVQPSEHEKSVISALDSASGLTRGTLGRRRRRAKGPNPLSVKKGRRKFVSTQELPGRIMSQSKVSTTEDTSLNRTPFPTPSIYIPLLFNLQNIWTPL